MHPYTPRVLAHLGVKKAVYIPSFWREAVSLMAPRYTGRDLQEELLPGGYDIERRFDNGLVLGVEAEPAVLVPHFEEGFEEPSLINNNYYRQRLGRLGKVRLENTTDRALSASLAFDAGGAAGTVSLEMRLNGRTVGNWELGPTERKVTTPVLSFASGDSELELRVSAVGGGAGPAPWILMSALDVK